MNTGEYCHLYFLKTNFNKILYSVPVPPMDISNHSKIFL
jgi:hypothetical protein